MLRILHTEASTGWGGQEIRILQESLGMAKRGYHVMIAAERNSGLFTRASREGMKVFPMHFRKENPLSVLRMRHLINSEGIDIVNTHSSTDSWVTTVAAKLSGAKPIIIRTRHLSTPISRSFSSRLIYDVWPDAVMTTGERIRQQMIEVNGFDGSRIVSVPTGADLARFDPERVVPCFEKKGFLVGMVSVLRRWKGHEYFLKAIPEILKVAPKASFLIVGDGPQRENLRKLVSEMALGEKVMMPGHMEHIPEIMASLDVLVHPSFANEGVPQSILQAFAMKKPVIASDAGAIKEIVIDGETGFLIAPKDSARIAEKVIALYECPEMGRRFGLEGRRRVEKSCSMEVMLDKIEELYGKVLASREKK